MHRLEELLTKIEKLEYHQSLLMKMIDWRQAEFYKLVIEKSLTEQDVNEFMRLCEELSLLLEEQKAEGFVYFYPLFETFKSRLHPNLPVAAVIDSCLAQQLFLPLMRELKKFL